MPDRILVINPNSTDAVTRAIDDAMAPLRITGGPGIDCVTLREGPPGVESQSDADAVIAPLCRAIRDAEPETAAFVIACFSDPGLFSAREATGKPVLGIAECGILTALTLGHRFGVISILARSVPRHLRYIAAMGVGQRLAGDLPIGLGVSELADGRRTLSRMIESGCRLRDQHRRRRAGHGVRRHGRLPRRSRRGRPDPGRRADPGRRRDGDRPHPPRLGTKLALRRGDAANHLPCKRQGCAAGVPFIRITSYQLIIQS